MRVWVVIRHDETPSGIYDNEAAAFAHSAAIGYPDDVLEYEVESDYLPDAGLG